MEDPSEKKPKVPLTVEAVFHSVINARAITGQNRGMIITPAYEHLFGI